MAWFGTRRLWRRIYRRSRLYIPVVVLLLLAMAVFLPLSAPWMARRAEREITAATGLPVSIERVRVRLWSGEAVLFGLQIGGGETPLRIESVRAHGPLSELLAGDGFWPDEIVVTGPAELRIAQTDRGIEPRGALATLAAGIGGALSPGRSGDPAGRPALGSARLPRVLVRNAAFRFEPVSPHVRPVRVHLNTIDFPGHEGKGQTFEATFAGVAEIERAESLRGRVRFLPGTQSLAVEAEVGGLGGNFLLPGLGTLRAEGDDVRVTADATRNADGSTAVRLEVSPARFEAFEMRAGGERWMDERLLLRLDARLSPGGNALEDVTMRLTGSEVDARLEGRMALGGGLQTDARLWVSRLPPAMYLLARREAAREGLFVEAMTSDTLRLDLTASGPLAEPHRIKVGGAVVLGHLRLRERLLPRAVEVRRVEGTVDSAGVAFSVIEAEYGDLVLRGTGYLPLLPAEGTEGTASIDATVEGSASSLLELARGRGFLPPDIRDAALPFSLRLHATVPAANRSGIVEVDRDRAAYSGTLAWRPGEVTIRGIPGSAAIGAGQVTFDQTTATFSHLSLKWREAAIDADLSLRSAGEGWRGRPAYDLKADVGGPVPVLLELGGHLTYLPVAPDFAGGAMQVRAEVSGVWGEWDATRYTVTASVLDGSATVRLPHPVAVDRIFAEAVATREGVEVRRVQLRIAELAEVQGTGRVTAEEARLDFELAAPLAVAERVAPNDVDEVVLRGHATGNGHVRLVAEQPLAEGPDIPRRWFATLGGPARIGIGADAPLRLELLARLLPGEDVSVFQRDFPHPVTNIRGTVEADVLGLTFRHVKSRWGAAEDVTLDGRMNFGHNGPFEIDMDVSAPELDLNEWLHGWGEGEWARRPVVDPRLRRHRGPEPRLMALIQARLRVERARFLSVRAQNVDTTIVLEAWRNRRNLLEVTVHDAAVYGGRIQGNAGLDLKPPHTEEHTYLRARMTAAGVQMQTFLTDLREQPEEFTGLFSGTVDFEGSLGNYDDWVGEGEYRVEESRFIGDQAFRRLSSMLNLGREKFESATTIRGRAYMSGRQVRFPDMIVQNRDIRIATAGAVFFDGAIDFLATVEVLTARLGDVPVVSSFVEYFNSVKNMLVSLHLTGTVREPVVTPVTLTPDRLTPAQYGRGILKRTERTLRSGHRMLGRGVESLPFLPRAREAKPEQ